MANPQIIVEYLAKTEKLKAASDDLGKTSSKIAGATQKAFLPAVGALGAIGVAAGKAITDASNLSEQVNKTGVVFGKASPEIVKWSKTTAESIGISQRAALEATGTFGNMLVPMGIAREDAGKMSTNMVKLAADMASFNNASPEDTLEALRAGLAGETEPLRKFGVFLSEDRIAAQALSSGLVKAQVDTAKLGVAQVRVSEATAKSAEELKKHGKGSDEYAKAVANQEYAESQLSKTLEGKVPKLTAAQKAQASYALITKDTADAQGDFAATSDSVANKQRLIAAQAEDTSAAFGKALLPAMTAVQGIAISLLGVFGDNVGAIQVLVGVVGGLAAAIIALNIGMKVWIAVQAAAKAATVAWTAVQWLLNAALTANPIGIVIVAIGALVAALIVAYKTSDTFRRIVDAAFETVVKAAKAAFNWVKANWPLLLGILAGPFGLAVVLIIKHWDKISGAAKSAVSAISGALGAIADAFMKPISALGVCSARSGARWGRSPARSPARRPGLRRPPTRSASTSSRG